MRHQPDKIQCTLGNIDWALTAWKYYHSFLCPKHQKWRQFQTLLSCSRHALKGAFLPESWAVLLQNGPTHINSNSKTFMLTLQVTSPQKQAPRKEEFTHPCMLATLSVPKTLWSWNWSSSNMLMLTWTWKAKMRGNKCLFRIENHCNSGSTDSGRNPVSQLGVMVRNFFKKKKRNNYVNRKRHFYWC